MIDFETYPFEKLEILLDGTAPDSTYEPLTLTVGEPQSQTPKFIQDELCNSSSLLNRYPATAGERALNDSMMEFVKRRFGVDLKDSELLSTLGTREVLFNFPQHLLFGKDRAVMAYTNPFYQIYEGAAKASGAEVFHLDLTKENSYKPDTSAEFLKKCDLVILNFPNNPTASILSVSELEKWVELALKFDFVLLNDECYSEIYLDTPPPSLLEASLNIGNSNFKNIVVINSISKRSSAPGLRSGFIAGDSALLHGYKRYRTYVGCASPIPLQRAATLAWSDDKHVQNARETYRENFKLAKKILGITPPDATFYIWLKVDNALEFTLKLYREYNLKVLPGEYLSRGTHKFNIGKDYIRIALVDTPTRTEDALMRIKEALC